MTNFRLILSGVFSCLAIYLFASAPPPLPDAGAESSQARSVEAERMLLAANAINDAARRIYTERIVGPGIKSGLKFGEDWAEPGIAKGPLPALFLRLAAQRLEHKPKRLSLYLGSDAPINKSNLFDDSQISSFDRMRDTGAPVFSDVEGVGTLGMFPDVASAMPCVTCHNEHPDSPKTDWELNDIMGATTWVYPAVIVGADDYLSTTEQLFLSIEEAYGAYISKIESFGLDIKIGDDWPTPTRAQLPDLKTFMTEVREFSSPAVVNELVLISASGE